MDIDGRAIKKQAACFRLIIEDEAHKSWSIGGGTADWIKQCRAIADMDYKPHVLFLSGTALQNGPRNLLITLYKYMIWA